ncbi:MAG TPA: hypothetical protein VIY47_08860, partial [Ignavibacteriaceae bacterium]
SFVIIVIVLNANPRKKVAVHARVMNSLFFIAVFLIRLFKYKKESIKLRQIGKNGGEPISQ